MTPHNELEKEVEEKFDIWRMLNDNEKYGIDYAMLPYLKKFIYSLVFNTRQDTVREVIAIIDDNYRYMRKAQSAGVEWQLVALSIVRDDVVELGEDYNIKDE